MDAGWEYRAQLTGTYATVSPDWKLLLMERLLPDLPTADRGLLVEAYTFGSTSYELGPKMGVSALIRKTRHAAARRWYPGHRPTDAAAGWKHRLLPEIRQSAPNPVLWAFHEG